MPKAQFDFVLGTEPASENRIRSCCGSTPGIGFYCKPVTLVRCREIRGENRFSGRVGGKWLCEMISAFIIKELRGAWALRLFCGRSTHPPPFLLITNCYLLQKPEVDGHLYNEKYKGVVHMLRVFAYLQQHPVSGVFYYRETIPAHLRPVLGKREIKKSLGTGRKTEAIRAAQLLHAKTIELFERTERRMTPKKGKPTPDAAQTAAAVLAALEGASSGPAAGLGKIVLNLAGGKVTIVRDDPAEEAAIAARLLSTVPAGPAPAADPRRTGRPRKDAAPMLSDLIKGYFDEIKLTGTQQPKTVEENQSIFQLLLEVTRNPLAESVGIKAATDFKTALLMLPSNRTKGKNHGKTVLALKNDEQKKEVFLRIC